MDRIFFLEKIKNQNYLYFKENDSWSFWDVEKWRFYCWTVEISIFRSFFFWDFIILKYSKIMSPWLFPTSKNNFIAKALFLILLVTVKFEVFPWIPSSFSRLDILENRIFFLEKYSTLTMKKCIPFTGSQVTHRFYRSMFSKTYYPALLQNQLFWCFLQGKI